MTIIQDGLGALVTYLKAQSAIISLIGTRVYGLEMPKADAASNPRKTIVITNAGGIGKDSDMDVFKWRLDFKCYGETPFEAEKVWRTLRPELRDLDRNVTSSTTLYNATHSAGPFYFRDQPTEWPHIIDTWLVKIQDTVVT